MLYRTVYSMKELIYKRKIPFIAVCLISVLAFATLSGFKTTTERKLKTPNKTGAPFNDNLTCGECHSGGTYGGSITTQMLDAGNVPVTSYVPGQTYTFKITLIPATGTPGIDGFQTSCAKVTGLTDISTWGSLPLAAISKFSKRHTYVEHTNKFLTNTVSIPWVGPPAGTGSVIFYTAGVLTNKDLLPTGDDAVNNSMILTEAAARPAPLQNKYALSLYAGGFIKFSNKGQDQKVQVTYADMQGRPLQVINTTANKGDNVWAVPKGKLHGLTVVNVVTQDGNKVSLKMNITN